VELATKNARSSHESRFRKSQQDRLQIAATRLGEILGHSGEINRIESFDISNFQGTDSVAGMVVFDRGKLDKKQYRTFNIRTVEGADDFRSMAEAVERRYKRLLEDEKEFPDLILIDGGRGQLNAALIALNRLGIEGTIVAGLAKREEEIYLPDLDEPLRLDRHEPALQLLQMIRDEGPKTVKARIEGDELRVTSKSRDDLQAVQQMLKGADLDVALQFTNYR
jgi:excinuclease ABC subunit C